ASCAMPRLGESVRRIFSAHVAPRTRALHTSPPARPATEDDLAARLRLLAAAATRARELVARALPAH
ncbi:MAG: hypothetical protein MPK62_14815, partial [Alphaproteobacteria bacterium]|nr:hypothetical protein [Alphaproteobacteria bacterium]